MLILSERKVQRLLDIKELIQTLEQAHVQFAAGKAIERKVDIKVEI